jgi:hypothetical protein
MRPSVLRTAPLLLLLAVVLAACGSSSKGASSSNNSSSNGSSTTAAPSAGATTTVKVSGDSNSSFCQDVRNSAAAFKPVDPAQLNLNSLKSELENVGPDLQKAASAAPDAIKPDFETFVHAYTPYIDALKAANFDFTKLNLASLQNLNSASVKAAIAHLEAYFSQVCHVTAPTSPTVSIP